MSSPSGSNDHQQQHLSLPARSELAIGFLCPHTNTFYSVENLIKMPGDYPESLTQIKAIL